MVKEGTYICIQSWMRNELQLSGNELIVYAMIYGFSMDGTSEFRGSLKYIMEWTGAAKTTVMRTLKALEEKKLINRKEIEIASNLKLCTYSADTSGIKTLQAVSKDNTGGIKTVPSLYQNATGGGTEMLPNNINNIPNKNNNFNNKRFTPPTVEEVKAYCIERKNNVDAEHFVNYYESNGWMVGKNHMKNWKSAVVTWEKNNYSNSKKEERTNRVKYDWGEEYKPFC